MLNDADLSALLHHEEAGRVAGWGGEIHRRSKAALHQLETEGPGAFRREHDGRWITGAGQERQPAQGPRASSHGRRTPGNPVSARSRCCSALRASSSCVRSPPRRRVTSPPSALTLARTGATCPSTRLSTWAHNRRSATTSWSPATWLYGAASARSRFERTASCGRDRLPVRLAESASVRIP